MNTCQTRRSMPRPRHALLLLTWACGSNGPTDAAVAAPPSLAPATWSAGDTLTLTGTSLSGARARLGTLALTVTRATPTRVVLRLPSTSDLCAAAGRGDALEVSAGASTWRWPIANRLRATEVRLMPAQYVAIAAAADGLPACRLQLLPGEYAVSVVVPPRLGDRDARMPNIPLQLQLVAATSSLAARLTTTAGANASTAGERAATAHRRLPSASACEANDSVRVQTPSRSRLAPSGTTRLMRRVASSASFALWADSAISLAPAQAALTFQRWERDVRPFLARVFSDWPDTDGQSQLRVYVHPLTVSGQFPLSSQRVDLCPDDAIWINADAFDAAASAATLDAIAVHESSHWFDQTGGPIADKAPWSVEGFAILVARLFTAERNGETFWDNLPTAGCPNCVIALLDEGRWGMPGLSLTSGSNGASLLEYLAMRVTPRGQPPYRAFARLRFRPPGLEVSRTWSILSSEPATEAALLSEFMLTLGTDDLGVPFGPALTLPRLDLTRVPTLPGESYPLQSYVVDATRPYLTTAGEPDGRIGRVQVSNAKEVLALLTGHPSVALGIARLR